MHSRSVETWTINPLLTLSSSDLAVNSTIPESFLEDDESVDLLDSRSNYIVIPMSYQSHGISAGSSSVEVGPPKQVSHQSIFM